MAKKSKKKTTKKKVAKKTVKKKAPKKAAKKTVKKSAKKKETKPKVSRSKPKTLAPNPVTSRRLKKQEKNVDDMLKQLESVKPSGKKQKKNMRPMSATVTLLSIIGIIVSGYAIYPKNHQWGIAFLVVFFILLIASMYSLTLE